MQRPILNTVLGAFFVICAGCSQFDKDWEQAVKKPAPAGFEGAWEGRWQSQNGHGDGDLRCLLSKVGDDEYLARFRATYWWFFNSQNDIVLKGEEKNSALMFAGEKDLGWLAGGNYKYKGHATDKRLTATYQAKDEWGAFEMERRGSWTKE